MFILHFILLGELIEKIGKSWDFVPTGLTSSLLETPKETIMPPLNMLVFWKVEHWSLLSGVRIQIRTTSMKAQRRNIWRMPRRRMPRRRVPRLCHPASRNLERNRPSTTENDTMCFTFWPPTHDYIILHFKQMSCFFAPPNRKILFSEFLTLSSWRFSFCGVSERAA